MCLGEEKTSDKAGKVSVTLFLLYHVTCYNFPQIALDQNHLTSFEVEKQMKLIYTDRFKMSNTK